MVDDAIELLAHSIHQYQLTLHTTLNELLIIGDPHRIEQVIINLLTNAIRYSPGKDRIEIYLSQEDGQVKVGIKILALV